MSGWRQVLTLNADVVMTFLVSIGVGCYVMVQLGVDAYRSALRRRMVRRAWPRRLP